MSICKICKGSGWKKVKECVDEYGNTFEESITCPKCYGTGETPATNADRIRAMSDEELAEFLESTHSQMAIKLGGEYIVREKEYIGIWLKQPAEEVQK